MGTNVSTDVVDLSAIQLDALRELINIGVGRAAGILNALIQSHVHLHVPFVEVLSPAAVESKAQTLGRDMLSTVQLSFRGPFSGVASLVFPPESAAKLIAVLTNEDFPADDLDSIRIGTLTEVGNIVLNGVMGVIGNELQQRIHYSVPTYAESSMEILFFLNDSNGHRTVIWAQAQFTIEQHQINGDIVLLFEVGSFNVLLDAIDRALER
jgi:chemotaxis protein CheC